jgi:hypothetical protein
MNVQDLQFVSALGQAILMAVLPVLATVLTRWLISRAKVEVQKLDANTLGTLVYLASIAVNAAEQAKMSGWIGDKKKYAVDFCQNWLSSRGFSVNIPEIEAAIEAAVYEEFNKPSIEEAKSLKAIRG